MSIYFLAQGVECARNDRVLFSPLDFSLSPGEILHLRGANGIGKTTVLRCLAGFSAPYSGNISWLDKNVVANEEYKKSLLFLGHKNAIKSMLTVFENLQLSPSLHSDLGTSLILETLERVGIKTKIHVFAGELSSGQKQRLALARLLLFPSKLWILDEPFNALDTAGFNMAQCFMAEHVDKGGMIVFTSHHPLSRDVGKYFVVDLKPKER
ncbi:MAG: cytochrome c biogenesis heme-transporting ATPase CcmA [Gammaproteobacteria bacterium]|nr:cytochrome c biogenesis heme-transporting ATPase CcmA [Gammaproteobacteria bacterium]